MTTTIHSMPRNLLRLSDLSSDDIRGLLKLAIEMKAHPREWTASLRGTTLGCIFGKPSTRTRVSLAVAANRLGMLPVSLAEDELQISRGETWNDTGRVLSSYLDALTIRTYQHATIEELARASTVPVINALSNTHHPCQALADLLALTEHFGTLDGVTVAFIGDASSNILKSLLEACALSGINLVVASPPGHVIDRVVLTEAKLLMARHGGSVKTVTDPSDAVTNAQAVYAEVWVPMDRVHEHSERQEKFSGYRVDETLMSKAPSEAVAMHCLPAHRGQEISSEVLDGPRSLAWRQAANRLPTAQAVLYALVNRQLP